MLTTNVISLILCIVMFSIGVLLRPIYGILIIIFFLPMANRLATFGDIRISFVALLIFSFFLGYAIKKNFIFSNIKGVRYKGNLGLAIVSILISLCILVIKDLPYSIEILEANVTQNVTNYLSAILSAIIFYLLIVMETYSFEQIQSYIKTFVLTLLFLAVIFLTNILGITLPRFISPIFISEGIGGEQIAITMLEEQNISDKTHFTGYIGYIENFAEYLFILFVFGFIVITNSDKNKIYKTMGAMCCVLTLLFAIPTAIKAFPVMVGLFLLSLFIFLKNRTIRIGIFIFLIIAGLIPFYIRDYLMGIFFFQRFEIFQFRYALLGYTFNIFDLNDIAFLSGRPDLIAFFRDIVETGGIFGIGPFVVWLINGSDIPFHNLYYALYLNFGLSGFIIFITLFARIIIDLTKAYKNVEPSFKITSLSFLFLFIILLIGQMKVSSFRISSGILMYWFLFALFASFSNIIERKNRLVSP